MIRKPPLSGLQLAALAAPVLAILVLMIFTIGSNVAASRQAKRVNQATEFVDSLTVLVHELQEERDRSAGQAASGSGKPSDDLAEARKQADQALELWRDAIGGLPRDSFGRPLRDALTAAGNDLGKLGEQRKRIDAGELPKFLDATKYYIDTVGHLLVVVDRVADETTDPALRTSLRTVSALAWSKENASQERGLLNWMLTTGDDGIRDQASQALLAQMSGAEFTWLVQFRVAAPKAQEELFEQVVSGDEVNRVGDLRTRAISEPDRLSGVKPAEWMSSATTKADLMREVEQRLVDKAKADSASARSSALKGTFTGTMPTILALLVAAAGAFVLLRAFPQQGQPPARRSAGDEGYEPARWPEEPAAPLRSPARATEVLRPYDPAASGPRPAYGSYDQPGTGQQPAPGVAGRWPSSGPDSGQWSVRGQPGGEWPTNPGGVADDGPGGPASWPGMSPAAAAPGAQTPPPWNAAPPGAPGQGPGARWPAPQTPAAAGAGAGGGANGAPWAATDTDTGPVAFRGQPGQPGQPAQRERPPTRDWRGQQGQPPSPPQPPQAPQAPPQAGGGLAARRSTAGERLPIFEETRYDWFRTGGNQAAGAKGEDVDDLLANNDPARLFGDPAGVTDGTATATGLPRRRQGASMNTQLAGTNGSGTGTTVAPTLGNSVRSPEDLRAALDSYQSGFERGKQEAMRWFKDMPGGSTR